MDKELVARKEVRQKAVAKTLDGIRMKYREMITDLPEEEANLLGLEFIEEAVHFVASERLIESMRKKRIEEGK